MTTLCFWEIDHANLSQASGSFAFLCCRCFHDRVRRPKKQHRAGFFHPAGCRQQSCRRTIQYDSVKQCISTTCRAHGIHHAGHTDGTIQSVTANDTAPSCNEEANFDCKGASYCILADGAAGVITDEAAGTCELFLADDTVKFQGVYKKRKELFPQTP